MCFTLALRNNHSKTIFRFVFKSLETNCLELATTLKKWLNWERKLHEVYLPNIWPQKLMMYFQGKDLKGFTVKQIHCEHLKYLEKLYYAMTNHSKDQDIQASQNITNQQLIDSYLATQKYSRKEDFWCSRFCEFYGKSPSDFVTNSYGGSRDSSC